MTALAIAPIAVATEAAIEATDPDVIHRKSVDGNYGIGERIYGLAARVTPGIFFEEYNYWAKVERDLEIEDNRKYMANSKFSMGKLFKKQSLVSTEEKERRERALSVQPETIVSTDEKKRAIASNGVPTSGAISPDDYRVSDYEWRQAARALRTASWGGMFYLVTTDILGWSNCPFTFASVGYGTGVAVYIVFGLAAAFSAFGIWRTFLGLDSSRYPMLSFGDGFYRVFGPKWRHFINIMQSIQQFLTVAVLVLGQGSTLSEIAEEKICFVACMIIIMVIGMISGVMRKLSQISWLANASVWMNVTNFIIIMVASRYNGIYYPAVTQSTLIKTIEPVRTFAGAIPDAYQQQAPGFAGVFNGINQMVYAYSGALLFVAFLAEMRHPLDFWKGVFLAQAFICFVYILFGAYVYSNFGQYSASLIGTVILPFSLQTVGNVLTLLTGFIAIFLYFNIGMKTVYLEVFQEIMHFPPITTSKGRWCWYALGPFYWILAFVVAAALPNLNAIVSIVGGLFSLNFTYSLPGLMYLGFLVNQGATLPGEGYDPATGVTTRHDSGYKRYVRGYFKRPILNGLVTLYVLAGLACSGMGTWAGIEGAIAVFGPGGTVATSFGCPVPL